MVALRVFLSYRRNDSSAATGRLSDALRHRLGDGNVFLDIDEIAWGADIRETISIAVRSADVVLVMIGDRWLEDVRLGQDADYVTMEVEEALNSDRQVIPVLVDRADMPSAEQLPTSLRRLSRLNAWHLSYESFHDDIDRLLSTVEAVHGETSSTNGLESGRLTAERRLIFISYAREDAFWLDRIKTHLKPLTRRGRLELWDDSRIGIGDQWSSEIGNALEECVAAILVVSADFLASDFVHTNELPRLLDGVEEREVQVFPVLVSSSSIEDSELGHFQTVNPPSRPLDLLPKGEQEAVLHRLYKAVEPLIQA